MLLAVRLSRYGCAWEVWRALQLKKLELLSTALRETRTLLSCSPKLPVRPSKYICMLSINQFFFIIVARLYLMQSRYTNRTETKQKQWPTTSGTLDYDSWPFTIYNREILSRDYNYSLLDSLLAWFCTNRSSVVDLTGRYMRFSGSWRLWRERLKWEWKYGPSAEALLEVRL